MTNKSALAYAKSQLLHEIEDHADPKKWDEQTASLKFASQWAQVIMVLRELSAGTRVGIPALHVLTSFLGPHRDFSAEHGEEDQREDEANREPFPPCVGGHRWYRLPQFWQVKPRRCQSSLQRISVNQYLTGRTRSRGW